MATIEYWGEDLSFNENATSLDEMKKVIEQIYTARNKALNKIPNIEDNVVSATALMLIGMMYELAKYDTSDIPNPDEAINVNLNIFNRVYKMRLPAKYEEHYRKVAKEYNIAVKQIENSYNISQERAEQLSILLVAKQYYYSSKNHE